MDSLDYIQCQQHFDSSLESQDHFTDSRLNSIVVILVILVVTENYFDFPFDLSRDPSLRISGIFLIKLYIIIKFFKLIQKIAQKS